MRISYLGADTRILCQDECARTSSGAATRTRAISGAECMKRCCLRVIYHGWMATNRLFAQYANNFFSPRKARKRDICALLCRRMPWRCARDFQGYISEDRTERPDRTEQTVRLTMTTTPHFRRPALSIQCCPLNLLFQKLHLPDPADIAQSPRIAEPRTARVPVPALQTVCITLYLPAVHNGSCW